MGSVAGASTAAPPNPRSVAPSLAPYARASGRFRSASKSGPLVLAINLERRADRIERLRKLDWSVKWERLPAVDGRLLSWDSVDCSLIHPEAAREAAYAEAQTLPTICRHTGSFSPHLTLAAFGCGLSHRAAWQCLAEDDGVAVGGGRRDWALILEDDVSGVAKDFEAKLAAVVRGLPPTWGICYLGFHESQGTLLAKAAAPQVMELDPRQAVTGLFGYVLRRSAAAALLGSVFPLRHQVDFAMCGHQWGAGARFVVSPQAVLLTSPKSEEGACDTDVQTLGSPEREAHRAMPASMVRL